MYKKSKIIYSLVFYLVTCTLLGCKNTPNTQIVNLKDSHTHQFSLVDSVKVFNDSLSFEYFLTENWDKNKLLAFQIPSVNLTLLDTVGNIQKNIGEAGLKPDQFRSQFIDAKWFKDKLYVLAEGNYFSLSIYDKNLKFQKKVDLYKEIKNSYVPIKTCSFVVLEGDDDNIKFIISNGDKRYDIYSKKYYDRAYGLLSFQLNGNFEITDVKKSLPLSEFKAIQTALQNNKRNWNTPNLLFAVKDTLLYVKPTFDDNVYIYNSLNLKLTKILHLPLRKTIKENYYLAFDLDLSYNTDALSQIKIQYRNIKYVDFKLDKNYLIVMYTAPVRESQIPQDASKVGLMDLTFYLDKINLTDQSIDNYKFTSKKFNPYSFYLTGNYLLLAGNSYLTESPYLYKLNLN